MSGIKFWCNAILFMLISKQVTCKSVARFGDRGRGGRAKNVFTPYGPSDWKNYYTSYDIHGSSYGTLFGSKPLESNTHIYNNNFKVYDSSYRKFRAEDLFKRDSNEQSKLHTWTENGDRRWRLTTNAPYFENKIPQSNKFLPAAAVVGNYWGSNYRFMT